MKKIVSFVTIMLLLSHCAFFAFAKQTMTEEDKAKFGLALSLSSLKKYDESIEVLKDLRKRFPDDKMIDVELINSLYGAGMDKEAEEELAGVLKQKLHDTKAALRLVGIFADRKRYREALTICEGILAQEPDNKEAVLWLARLLSWDGQYERSLRAYTEMINKFNDWVVPRLEKARVMGWDHQYVESIEEYKNTIKEVKTVNEAVRAEMAAKDDYYKSFDSKGITDYKKWLELEQDNLEALFDLAQVYSRQMQWSNAEKLYSRILSVYPQHSRAKIALDKTMIYSRSASAETGFEHYQASSTSRDVDEDYWDIYTNLRTPINEDIYLSAREDTVLYDPSTAKSFTRQKMGIALEYNKRPTLWARAAYAYSVYTGQPKNSNNFNGEINFKPIDSALFTFLCKREDVEDNPQTMIRNLKRDDYKIRTTIEPNRRIGFGADYMYSHYTDKNDKFTYGVDVKTQVLYEPHSLALTYRYEEYGYGEPRDYYFTPGSFHYNTAVVEWRQFLNRELFWGNNETYYTLKYAVNFDVHDQVGHLLYADFHHDWNNRFSTYVEWSKKIYDHRNTYGEERVMVYGKLYF